MPIETNLDTSPYFDDFDRDKDYYKILFKPGVAVQARELNQLQTMTQSQIEQFGNHVFKSGTIVDGVNFNYLTTYPFAKITDQQVDGQTSLPSSYVGYMVKSTANLVARVVNSVDGLESKSPDLKAIYLQYVNSGTGGEANYAPNQTLTVFSLDNEIFKVSITNGGVGIANSDNVQFSSALIVDPLIGVINVGAEIVQSTTGAIADVIEVDTTTLEDTRILRVKPRVEDLSNTSLTSAAWTFVEGYQITAGSNTANVTSIVGSGATAIVTTDTEGIVQIVSMTSAGEGYIVPPVVTVQTSNTTAGIASLSMSALNYKAQIRVANSSTTPIGAGYAFGVSDGVIYQKGYFLDVNAQTIIVSKFDNEPDDIAVGFKSVESFVTASQDDTLYDNAANTSNFSAPGADRLKMIPELTLLSIEEAAANTEFFALAEWKEGNPYKENRTTVYSTLGEEMARRTSETSGDFVIDKFLVTTKDLESNATNLNTSTHVSVAIDPGLAYIGGTRIHTIYNDYVDIPKSTTLFSANTQTISANYGNYVRVKEFGGQFPSETGGIVHLYSAAQTFISNNSALDLSSAGGLSGSKIGQARIRSIVYDSGTPGTGQAVYRMYLFDISMNAGKSFRQVRSIYSPTSGARGIADVQLVYNGSTAGYVAEIVDTRKDQMIFATGQRGTANISSVSFLYRSSKIASLTAATGKLNITVTTDQFPYAEGPLSDQNKRDLYIIPTEDTTASVNIGGSITWSNVAAGATTLLGTSTSFLSQLDVGDHIKIVSTSNAANYLVRQVVSVANNTQITVTPGIANANHIATANAAITFPAYKPIPLVGRDDRVCVADSNTSVTVNTGITSLSNTVDCYVAYNLQRTSASPVTKTVTRNAYVKVGTGSDGVGPWPLGMPGIIRLRGVYMGANSSVSTSDRNVTKYFFIDSGDDENAYRNGMLVRRSNAAALGSLTSKYFLVKYDVLTTGGQEGYFSINSYNLNDDLPLPLANSTIHTLEVPELVTNRGMYFDMRDVFDFRPVSQNTAALTTTAASATVSPANTFSLSGDLQYFPVPDSTISYNIEYYGERQDRAVAYSNGSIGVVQGETASEASLVKAPDLPQGAVTLSVVRVPPYPTLPAAFDDRMVGILDRSIGNNRGPINRRRSMFAIAVRPQEGVMDDQPRRYTMADIAKLERRINDLEYYTSLSQLETAIKDKSIASGLTPTVDRFKYGFMVDGFANYDMAAKDHRQFDCTIDQYLTYLKPAVRQVNFESQFDRTHATTNNAIIKNKTLMLPFTDVALFKQGVKTSVVGSDGQKITFSGSGTIEPASFSVDVRAEISIITLPPPPVSSSDGGGSVSYYSGGDGGGWSGGDGGSSSSDGGSSSSGDSGSCDSGGDGGGDGGSGGGKIVCTMMNRLYGFNAMSSNNRLWMRYNEVKQYDPSVQQAYHKLFLPLVKMMPTNAVVRTLLIDFANTRTEHIARELAGKPETFKSRCWRAVVGPAMALTAFGIRKGWIKPADISVLDRIEIRKVLGK